MDGGRSSGAVTVRRGNPPGPALWSASWVLAPAPDAMASPCADPVRSGPVGTSSVSGGGGMWAGSGGVWAIGVRVGSGESSRCIGEGASGLPPVGALRSTEAPAERLPRALRALEPGADRAGGLLPPGGRPGG